MTCVKVSLNRNSPFFYNITQEEEFYLHMATYYLFIMYLFSYTRNFRNYFSHKFVAFKRH